MIKETFTLTEDHLKLLGRAYVGWEDCEYGAPAIDCKRPYGNSDVEGDVAEILGWTLVETREGKDLTPTQAESAANLHRETLIALQIVLATKSFVLGTYELAEVYDRRSWCLVE